jgi:hypothetical protein
MAEHEIVLVAPFVKEQVIRQLLEVVNPAVEVVLVTRWRPEEILAGASDVAVYSLFARRREAGLPAQFGLLDPVHAKYYRCDETVMIGSANLTATGLGLTGGAIEVLLPVSRSSALDEFEREVRSLALEPTPEVVVAFEAIAALAPSDIVREPGAVAEAFFPGFRNPGELWEALVEDVYPPTMKAAAEADVEGLGIRSVLPRPQFRAAVTAAFGTSSLVSELRLYCSRPRRFGELRQWVKARTGEIPDETPLTQTLLRWVVEYLPEEFEVVTANYSEILHRHPPSK